MQSNKIKKTFEMTNQQEKKLMKVINAVMKMGAKDEGRALELMADDVISGGILGEFERAEADAVDLKLDNWQVEGKKKYDF